MKNNILKTIFKVIFSLLLLMPIMGVLGFVPAPTRDLYNTDLAFEFIQMLEAVGYINYLIVFVNVFAVALLWMKREAFAALLVLPVVVNIFAFHLFLDGGLFTGGAIPAVLLLLLNIYFLWLHCDSYKKMLCTA